MAIEKALDQIEDDVINEDLTEGAMGDPDEVGVEITVIDPEAVAIEMDD